MPVNDVLLDGALDGVPSLLLIRDRDNPSASLSPRIEVPIIIIAGNLSHHSEAAQIKLSKLLLIFISIKN
jgi:hypothetical protein